MQEKGTSYIKHEVPAFLFDTQSMRVYHVKTIAEPERGMRPGSARWYARCGSNARPSESESDTLSS